MVTTTQGANLPSNDVALFSHRDLYEECRAAYINLSGLTHGRLTHGTELIQPRYYFTHEELLDWWNSVYQWDNAMEAWVYTPEVQKALER